MRRILIAGCGYVGAATADLFHAHGWEVEGWTASRESADALAQKPYRVRAVDLMGAAMVRGESEFDVVIHCASSGGGNASDYRRVYLEGARNLAAAFADARLLFTSSTSVYAQTSGEWVDETSPAQPARETGRILRETEDLVLQSGGIVARVAGIYGPGRSALLRKFLAGEAVIDPADRFLNQVHRDDIASALLLLAQNGRPSEIYNIADDDPISQRTCYEWLAAQLHRPVPPCAVGAAERKRGSSNKRVSNKKLRALGWQPRFPTFQEAMTESILPALARCGA